MEKAIVSGDEWQLLDGLTTASTFPASAQLGGETILIFSVGEGFRGVQRTCPHQDVSLATASIVGNGSMIRCASHGYTFKLENGKGVNCPGFQIDVFEIRQEGEQLFARRAE